MLRMIRSILPSVRTVDDRIEMIMDETTKAMAGRSVRTGRSWIRITSACWLRAKDRHLQAPVIQLQVGGYIQRCVRDALEMLVALQILLPVPNLLLVNL